MSNNSNTSFEKTFDNYGKLFYNIIINLLQVGIVFVLFICMINISKKEANDLYPTDLESSYYVSEDYNCNLSNISSNESSFCKESDKIKNSDNKIRSRYSKELIQKGLIIGYATGSITEILSFLFYYLLFQMEHFVNILLNKSHSFIETFFNKKLLVFISIVPLMGLMNGFSQKIVFPFLIKLFRMNPNPKVNSGATFFADIFIHIFITFFCFFSILFLFLMIPSMVYFIYLLLY